MSKDLKDKTLEELERIVVELGQKQYLAGYIFKFIHVQNGRDVSALSTLSKAFRAQLVEQGYFISQLKVVESLSDADGSAKFLFELSDGERIESVLLPEDKRKTLCVSTQVGCAMGCGFCATAKIRLRRSLTAGEIVDQVNTAEQQAGPITGVVYMGMGEPLQNYDAVLKSIRILNDPAGKGVPHAYDAHEARVVEVTGTWNGGLVRHTPSPGPRQSYPRGPNRRADERAWGLGGYFCGGAWAERRRALARIRS